VLRSKTAPTKRRHAEAPKHRNNPFGDALTIVRRASAGTNQHRGAADAFYVALQRNAGFADRAARRDPRQQRVRSSMAVTRIR
jgi:hypothetical protein